MASAVAAGVSPAVEGGILPPGNTASSSERLAFSCVPAAGQDARLNGRRDACRYEPPGNTANSSGRLFCAAKHVLFAGLALLAAAGCGQQSGGDGRQSGSQGIKTKCGMEMVSIPAGQFTMGANDGPIDAKPAHLVKVDGFLMDRCEITQDIYQKVMGKNPSRRKNPQNPVEQVTWSAAAQFCNARSVQEGLGPCYNTNTWDCDFSASGYRLPTEAEWEYACRAGTGTRFYFGDDLGGLKSYAWFDGNSQAKPHPVGQRRPNAWGLYDMEGNVWEWCNDFYAPKYYRDCPPENPQGPKQGEKRILRGGAWSSSAEDCSAWIRNCDEPGLTDICLTMDSNGFRCARRK